MHNPFLIEGLADIFKDSDAEYAKQRSRKVSGKIEPKVKPLARKPAKLDKPFSQADKPDLKVDRFKVFSSTTAAKRNAEDYRHRMGAAERNTQTMHGGLREIYEPKRDPQSLTEIGVKLGGGLANIIAVLSAATPEEKEFWSRWYHLASGEVQQLASKFKLPFNLVAAATAALSPGAKWNTNLQSAERILSIFTEHPGASLEALLGFAASIKAQTGAGIAAYEENRKKAFYVLQTGDLARIKTRKVWVFYQGLIDPDGVNQEIESGSIDAKHKTMLNRKVTVDGHAINVWRGYKQPLKGMDSPNDALFAQIATDYEKAAQMMGLSTRAVQAITWYVWKYLTDPPPPARIPIKGVSPEGEPVIQYQEPSPKLVKLISRFRKQGVPIPPPQTATRAKDGSWDWADMPDKKKKT